MSRVFIRFAEPISRDRTNDLKLFPKSAKSLGTISCCPKCGRRGRLAFSFTYDSCNDATPHTCLTSKLRNLNAGKFTVTHWETKRKWKTNPIYLGQCWFNASFFDLLDGLLTNGRRIPESITREFRVDVLGRGYDVNGLKLWSAHA